MTALGAPAACAAIPVVAAESVYGTMAQDIAGKAASVTSILRNPAQDPHVFEADPAIARALAKARLVIMNGAGYDPWMVGLLGANPVPDRVVLDVAGLTHAAAGANPHFWADPATMHVVARQVAAALTALDGAEADNFAAGLARAQARLAVLDTRVAALRAKFGGTTIAATEPVFGPMASALDLEVRDMRFQLAVMNGTEPRPSDVATIEADLRDHKVRALVFNAQVTDASTQRLLDIARQAGVPVVGVTETQAGWAGLYRLDAGRTDAPGKRLRGEREMTAVSMHAASFGYQGRQVLSGIDLTLLQGEFVGLFGANGAGKTTLLRALLGLIQPATGTIEVLGAPAHPGQDGVGYLPQTRDGAVPPVRGVDVMAASIRGRRFGLPILRAADKSAMAWALAQVDAAALATRPLAQLSGGERQRVLIAQALLGNPRLLLLDEPLAGLDPRHQHAVVHLLRAVQKRLGLTVLCSAHDVNVLLPVMDRVLYLGGGNAALGTVAEIVTGPVLTRLYGAPIEVLHAGGRIFVSAETAASA